ncbi:MAG: D-alanyl-D-alanine carboxypeptidase family protein, partial [Thiohalorhabdaceae bacterium]
MPVSAKAPGAFLVAVLVLVTPPAAAIVPEPPSVEADALYLMEARSSQVLASRQADKQVKPGSLAKLMTAYLAFQALSEDRIALTDRVRISEAVWRMDGSQMFLEVDERVPVRKLLAGMVAINGNDAARALAEHIAGSVGSFARMMNRRAESLGMTDTVLTNPSGLPAPRMHTTAHDMALLARALLERFPQYLDLFNRSEVTHNGITQHNTRRLIRWGQGMGGLMTGRSAQTGHHLVAAAQRKNKDMRLIGAVLGAPD